MLASLALLTSLLGLSAVDPSIIFAEAKPGPPGRGNGNGHGPGQGKGPGGQGPPGQAPGGPHGGNPAGPAPTAPVGMKDIRTAVFARAWVVGSSAACLLSY